MAPAASSGSSPERHRRVRLSTLSGLYRVLLTLRLAALVLSILVELQQDRQRPLVLLAQAGVGIATALLLVRWQDAASLFSRPRYMSLDVAVTALLLYITGTQGPFLSYTLGAAGLAGAAFGRRGAILSTAALATAYWTVLLSEAGPYSASFQQLAGWPALYPIVAMAGAALRGLLEREAEATAALHAAQAEVAAQHERARLSRELHDFLGKSLVGLSLGASGLVALIRRDPPLAERRAREFAAAAKAAVRDARELVGDLRAETAEGTLTEAVRHIVDEWARRTGHIVTVDVDDNVLLSDLSRHELLRILQEALLNAERHADARRVEVTLRQAGSAAELTVRDDGRGFDPRLDIDQLATQGRYGIVGMRERTSRLGGTLTIDAGPDLGTTVTARFPPDGERGDDKARRHPEVS